MGLLGINDCTREIISIRMRMEENNKLLPHRACSIGFDIFLLLKNSEPSAHGLLSELVSDYILRLRSWSLEDLLVSRVGYAMKIVEHCKGLEGEDLCKLFSLCDDIYVLEYLGLSFDGKLKTELENSVRECFDCRSQDVKDISNRTVEDWSRELWWYKEYL